MAALLAALQLRLPQARLLSPAGSWWEADPPDPRSAASVGGGGFADAPERPGASGARPHRTWTEHADPRPEALWGYESVRLVLDAIRRSQHGPKPVRRDEVIREALTPRVRRSPLGSYSVQPSGAVSGFGLALFRLEGGRFEMVRALR